MLQAALLGFQFLDLCPFSDNGFVAPEVDVGGCDVVQARVVSFVVLVIDEGLDLAFEVTGQIVVFQQNPVLHDLMPALDLALGLRVERRSMNVINLVIFQPLSQIARDVTGAGHATEMRMPHPISREEQLFVLACDNDEFHARLMTISTMQKEFGQHPKNARFDS